jgi:hypothetical protein
VIAAEQQLVVQNDARRTGYTAGSRRIEPDTTLDQKWKLLAR